MSTPRVAVDWSSEFVTLTEVGPNLGAHTDPNTAAPIAMTDPNGNTTSYGVDANGNVTSTVDPLGRTTSATYNTFNEPLTKVDGKGVTTTFTYDAHGNLQTVSTPLVGSTQNMVTTYTYGDSTHPGDVTSMTDPDSKVWHYSYDTYGDQATVTDPLGNVSTTCYNADGWKLASYTPKAGSITCANPPPSSPYETTYSYTQTNGQVDGFGDVQKITDPLGHAVLHAYDADRNLTSTTDADGNLTTYLFDLANEQTDVRRADTTDLHTDFNLDGTVADQKDGKGNAILSYGYDSQARVTTQTDALSNATTFTYDLAGNELTRQDPGGSCSGTKTSCTTMTYDADNELTSITYSDGVTPNVTNITYDLDGQRTGLTDGTGTSTWAWDSLHRLTSFVDGRGDSVQYQYNLRGLVTQITYPGGPAVTRAYDDAGRWTSVQDWLGNTFIFGYDANSNLTTRTLPGGTNEIDTSGFNAADQLTSISDTQGSNTLFSATYGRDPNAQITSDSSVPSTVGSFKYTPLNQLCYAGSSNGSACASPPSGSQAYSLDTADNLVGNNGRTQAFNAADQLCWTVAGSSGNACASPPSGATAYTYNNRGDRTGVTPPSGSATTLSYDQANRLTGYVQATTSATYKYNADGLRMSKTVGGASTNFSWDVSGSLPLMVSDGTYDYVYGPGGNVVEEVLAPTFSLVGTASASGKSSSLKLTFPTGFQPNDQVLVATTQPSTTTVTAPSTYTQVATVTSGGSSPLATTTVFRHTIVSGDTSVTLTYSTSSTAQAAVLAIYRGVDPNQPVDVTSTGSAAASTSVTAPSVTPNYTGEEMLIVQGGVGSFSNKTWTPPTGTTERVQRNSTSNVSDGIADQLIGAGATGSRTSTFSTSANLTSILVGLVPLHSILLVGTVTASGNATSLRLTLPSGIQPNDQVVVASTQPSTTTVTAPSGYTQVATVTSSGSSPLATTTVFRHAVVSGDTSVTLTYSTSSTAQAAVLTVYRGVNPSQPVDVSATASAAASTSVTGPSVTTTMANDQLLMFQGGVGTFSGSSWTAPSSTTERAQNNSTANVTSGVADQLISTAGATGTRVSTFGQSANLTTIVVALEQPAAPLSPIYLHQDQIGSTRLITNSSGSSVATYQFDSYGNLMASTGTITTQVRFAGQYQDSESGLFYMRARYHDPTTGQFLSKDPLVTKTKEPYAYVADNPLNASDSSGLATGGLCLSAGVQLGPLFVGGSACVVADTHGNFGGTLTAGGGPGCCLSASVTGGLQASNADTIYDLSGPFAEAGGCAGEGPVGCVSGFRGSDHCGRDISGGYLGVGAGGGFPAELHAGGTYTKVFPWGGPGPTACGGYSGPITSGSPFAGQLPAPISLDEMLAAWQCS